MKLNVFLVILISTILSNLSCSGQDINPIGEYTSNEISFIDKARLLLSGKYKYILSTRLSLEKDNSFSFSTCGVNSKGKWRLSRDTLYLIHEEIKRSFPDSTTTRGYLPEVYIMAEDNFIGINENEYIEFLIKKE